MRTSILNLFLITFFLSCNSDKKVEGDLYFKTNFEDIQPFHESNQFVKTEGHSGLFCGMVDSTNIYGITFKAKLSDVLYKRVKKVKVSVWCKFLSNNSSGKLVISFLNGTDKVVWVGIDIGEKVKRLNQWEKISGEFDMYKEIKITPETMLYVYVWNTSKQQFYYDDLEISFDE